jgi:hypothetical protein
MASPSARRRKAGVRWPPPPGAARPAGAGSVPVAHDERQGSHAGAGIEGEIPIGDRSTVPRRVQELSYEGGIGGDPARRVHDEARRVQALVSFVARGHPTILRPARWRSITRHPSGTGT